jgi:hypothetical protein
MKYITVLDFEVSRVFQYKVKERDEFHAEDYYEICITQKGHKLNNCEWMAHEEPRVITTNHEAYQ